MQPLHLNALKVERRGRRTDLKSSCLLEPGCSGPPDLAPPPFMYFSSSSHDPPPAG